MSTIAINVHDEIHEAKLGKFHFVVAVLISFLTLFDGYDTFNPAYIIHSVMHPWHLNPAMAGGLVSSGLIGFLIGAGGHGLIADRIGRRKTLIGGFIVACGFTLLTALFADSFKTFCGLRFLTGLGLGVLFPLGTIYINEYAPIKSKNVFTIWGVGVGWALGGMMAGLVGIFVIPAWGWRGIYYVGAAFFVFLIPLYLYLPESARFLESIGEKDKLIALLTRLRPERKAFYNQKNIVIEKDFHNKKRGSVAVLLSPQYRWATLSIWISTFFALFCIFGLSAWIPTIMMKRGEAFSASFVFGSLIPVCSFFGGIGCGWIGDRVKATHAVLAVWWVIGAASVFVMAFCDTHIVNFFGVIAAGIFVVGGQFVLNNIISATYDTNNRATAMGIALAVGRVGGILGPFLGGLIQEFFPGSTGLFVGIGIASLIAGISIGVFWLCHRKTGTYESALKIKNLDEIIA